MSRRAKSSRDPKKITPLRIEPWRLLSITPLGKSIDLWEQGVGTPAWPTTPQPNLITVTG